MSRSIRPGLPLIGRAFRRLHGTSMSPPSVAERKGMQHTLRMLRCALRAQTARCEPSPKRVFVVFRVGFRLRFDAPCSQHAFRSKRVLSHFREFSLCEVYFRRTVTPGAVIPTNHHPVGSTPTEPPPQESLRSTQECNSSCGLAGTPSRKATFSPDFARARQKRNSCSVFARALRSNAFLAAR